MRIWMWCSECYRLKRYLKVGKSIFANDWSKVRAKGEINLGKSY